MAALAVAGRSADSDFRMEWFRVMSATGDIYIDSVYIGRQDTTDDFGKCIPNTWILQTRLNWGLSNIKFAE